VLDIEKPQQPSAWGIMVDADDPVTGEKVAASINIWTHVTDLAAKQLVDLSLYINGELSIQDITNGKYIHDWAQAAKLAGGYAGPTMSNEEITARLAAISHIDEKKMAEVMNAPVSDGVRKFIAEAKGRATDVVASNDVASPA